jgi:hypothetical protein
MGENRYTYMFWCGGLKERDLLEGVGLDGKRISELFLIWRGMDLVHLAVGEEKWRAVANKVMNLRVPRNSVKLLNG